MANKKLFNTVRASLPKTDTRNNEHAIAYKMSNKQALAQLAVTGCLNSTFYVKEKVQLDQVINLCKSKEISAEYIAKLAIYARKRGFMKDMPALLCAVLAHKDVQMLKKAFPIVINNGKMLRNFIQMIRADVVGRKSLGNVPKRLVEWWLDTRSDENIVWESVGNNPSMKDILKMIHPRPRTDSRRALYGYFVDSDKYKKEDLPDLVKQYEAFKRDPKRTAPNVPFQMLTSLPLSESGWKEIAVNAGWQMTRQNLNTFERHKVFSTASMVHLIADRLRDPKLIRKSHVFPYQLMNAFNFYNGAHKEIKLALQNAMDVATENTPAFDCDVAVCVDVSGSMNSPVTGERKGATTTVTCTQVAGLIASTVLRKNPNTTVVAFKENAAELDLNPLDSIMTNTAQIARLMGGGTACSAALRVLNEKQAKSDLVLFISDNESWADRPENLYSAFSFARTRTDTPTMVMKQWRKYKQRNKKAKMVCIDITPNRTVQAKENADILNIGGFADTVFTIIADFMRGGIGNEHWIDEIEKVSLSNEVPNARASVKAEVVEEEDEREDENG